MDPPPDPNWGKIQDPDPNSMFLEWFNNTSGGKVYRYLLSWCYE